MRRKSVRILLACCLVVVLGVAGWGIWLTKSVSDLKTDPDKSIFKNVSAKEEYTPPKWEGKERVNILLMGGDSRGLKKNEVPRSDSIMIVSMDPVTKRGYIFSVLRDTYVDIPGHGQDRINTAIATGGPNLAMKTVEDLLGIPINYYVYADFKGFIALVDAVGGIDIDVEKDMKYSDAADGHIYDINLKKGPQHLDGKHALQYVRFRHDATSDFTRTERQRKFMMAIADKLQGTFSLIKMPQIINKVDPYIETNMSFSNLVKLASLGFEVKNHQTISHQLPPDKLLKEEKIHGAAVITTDKTAVREFVKQTLESTGTGAAGSTGTNSGAGSDSTGSGSTGSSGTSSGGQ